MTVNETARQHFSGFPPQVAGIRLRAFGVRSGGRLVCSSTLGPAPT